MLTHLRICNVLLIDTISMHVPAGLVVLTGETGAGKSILMESLGLGLGGRSEASLIRHGTDQASVTLTFDLPKNHAAFPLLEEMGLRAAGHSDPLILRRILGADGRSKAFIDDQPVAIHALRRLGDLLVDIHSQFETHGLLDPQNHRSYLDSYGCFAEPLQALRQIFDEWQGIQKAYATALQQSQKLSQERDYLEHSIAELGKLAPQEGEAESLAEKRTHLQQREKIIETLHSANTELQGDGGAVQKLASARRMLLRAAEKAGDLVDTILKPLDTAEEALQNTNSAIDKILNHDDFDAHALEKIEERLFALRAAARKYQCTPEQLSQTQAHLETKLASLNNSDSLLAKLTKDKEKLEKTYLDKAEKLHQSRLQAAKKLEAALTIELAPLKLGGAHLTIDVEKLNVSEAAAHGISRIRFCATTNPDMPSGPLHKIASGGELARFMLALRLCLSNSSPTTTLVFDEVDTGIGGATAAAVGERLRMLGDKMQTLVITHSPQVAARGHHHWQVQKSIHNKSSVTSLRVLEGPTRCEEIARMLAGSTITPAAREAAQSLLDGKETAANTQEKPKSNKGAKRKAS